MTASAQNLTLQAGDDRELAIALTDAEGTAFVPDSAIWRLARRADGVAELSKTIGSGITVEEDEEAETVTLVVSLTAAETADLAGDYHHECEVVSDGAVSTVMTGRVEVTAGIRDAD